MVENLIGDPAFPYPFGHACKHSFGLEEINRYCIRWSGIVDGSGINGEKKFDAGHLQWQIQRSKAEDQSPDKKGPSVANRDLLEFGDRVKLRSLRKCSERALRAHLEARVFFCLLVLGAPVFDLAMAMAIGRASRST